MTNTNTGWPGKPGVPRDPHQSGWHWLSGATERPAAFEWLAHKQAWLFHRAQPEAQAMPPPAFGSWTYLGPCLTPNEAAALQKKGCARDQTTTQYCAEATALQARVAELEAENAAFRNNKTEEEALREMMRDPRYWRHRDPEWVNKVRDGFRKLIRGKDE